MLCGSTGRFSVPINQSIYFIPLHASTTSSALLCSAPAALELNERGLQSRCKSLPTRWRLTKRLQQTGTAAGSRALTKVKEDATQISALKENEDLRMLWFSIHQFYSFVVCVLGLLRFLQCNRNHNMNVAKCNIQKKSQSSILYSQSEKWAFTLKSQSQNLFIVNTTCVFLQHESHHRPVSCTNQI